MLLFLMVRSMTGFGRGEVVADHVGVAVEARSVNSRHLDLAVRLPRALTGVEMDARRLAQSRLERGRIEITVTLTAGTGAASARVELDAPLARAYLEGARALGAELGGAVAGDVTLEWLLERPGVLRLADGEGSDAGADWPLVREALARALDDLLARRAAEGERLEQALRGLHADLARAVETIAARAPQAATRREERLRERLRTLLGEAGVDASRILAEAAIWADKSDVTEELARLRAHLAEFALLLDKGGPVGRPLDFLIQELNREVNTVGSKADDLELSQAALAAKATLEKMREQVQNLE